MLEKVGGHGQTDSLSQALGWSVNEVHLTLWMASDEQPRGAFKAWWEARRDPRDVAEARRLAELETQRYPRTAQSGDLMWRCPMGTLNRHGRLNRIRGGLFGWW